VEIFSGAPESKAEGPGEIDAGAGDSQPDPDWPFQITVSEDKLEATIHLTGNMPEDISVARIREFLEQEGIRHGVAEDEEIASFLENKDEPGERLTIARGKPMIPGTDAAITCHFDKDYLSPGKIQEDGDIDYRDRGEIPWVQEGDLIAEKIPAKEGGSGINVHGNSIPAPDPEDTKLICESGTLLSEDGLKVHAKIDGQPNITVAGKLSVFAEFIVQGDVNYEIGNIEFDGNINVKGSVNDGFSIEGGNLSAKEVLGAKIHVKGDVFVSGGIMGANIEAEGNVIAKYIKNANIKAYGNIIAAKEIQDSKVRTSSKLINQSGKIISSLVTAKQGVEAKDIGTDVSRPCTIKVGGDEHIRKIVQGFENSVSITREDLEKEQSAYETLIFQQKTVHQKIAELTKIQDRAVVTEQKIKKKFDVLKKQDKKEELAKAGTLLKELKKKKNESNKKMADYFNTQGALGQKIEKSLAEIEKLIEHIEDLNKQKEAVITWSKEEKGIPVVNATGSIFSETKIHGRHSLIHISDTVRNSMVKEVTLSENDTNYEMKVFKD